MYCHRRRCACLPGTSDGCLADNFLCHQPLGACGSLARRNALPSRCSTALALSLAYIRPLRYPHRVGSLHDWMHSWRSAQLDPRGCGCETHRGSDLRRIAQRRGSWIGGHLARQPEALHLHLLPTDGGRLGCLLILAINSDDRPLSRRARGWTLTGTFSSAVISFRDTAGMFAAFSPVLLVSSSLPKWSAR